MSHDEEYAGYLRQLDACYPDIAVREVRPAQQGWDSVTLLVNGDTIFRFARRRDVAARLAREARLLPALADALPVAVPRFAYVCPDPMGGMRFVGYRALEGAPLDTPGRDPTHMPTLAQQLGAFLTALHSFPAADAVRLGALGGAANDWRREYESLFGQVREHVLPRLTEEERKRVVARWEGHLDDDANFAFAPALIHRDLGPEHVLHDPATGRLTGVIDWGDASIGDPAQDFTGLAAGLGEPFARAVLAHYGRPVGAAFWRRVRFYVFVIPYIEVIFGSLESDEGHVAAGLEGLRRQLGDNYRVLTQYQGASPQ